MDFEITEMLLIKDLLFSSDTEEDEEITSTRKRKKRNACVRPFYQDRDESGAHTVIVQRLRDIGDSTIFHNYFRMTATKYDELLMLTSAKLTKSTFIRKPINADMRLSLTLR